MKRGLLKIIIRNILRERFKLMLAISALAVSNFLVFFETGVLLGTLKQVTLYIDKSDVDIWVLQEGIIDLTSSMSYVGKKNIAIIQDLLPNQIEEFDGIYLVYTTVVIKEKSNAIYLVGIDPEKNFGGPWAITAGRNIEAKNEIIIDALLAESLDIKLGDTIQFSGNQFVVVGFSDETSNVATMYTFIHKDQAAKLLYGVGYYNYILIRLKDRSEQNILRVSRLIKNNGEKVSAVSSEALKKETLKFWGRYLIPLFASFIAASFLVVYIILSFLMYNITLSRLKGYGIMKAIGIGNNTIYAFVLIQSVLTALAGYLIGILLSLAGISIANKLLVGLRGEIGTGIFFGTFFLSLVIALLSSWFPLRRVSRIDPVEIIRKSEG